MYRSNDVVQFDDHSIYVRPFVKVGEAPENVKVLQYFIKNECIEEAEEQNGPDGRNIPLKTKIKKIGDFLKNIFSTSPILSTKSFQRFEKGQIEEVEFATTVWESEIVNA
jgi:hypothetical protein